MTENQNGTADRHNIASSFVQEEKGFDFRLFLFRYILRHWYLYVLGVALAYGGTWLYLRYTVPQFETHSTILIKNEGKSGNGGAISEETIFQGLGLGSGDKNIQNEIQILKSRTLMLEVVRELNLNYTVFTEGRVLTTEWYEGCPIRIDSIRDNELLAGSQFIFSETSPTAFSLTQGNQTTQHQYGKWVKLPQGSFKVQRNPDVPISKENKIYLRINDPVSVAASYASTVKIQPILEYASVLQLSLIDPQKNKARDILDKLVEVYNRAAIEDKNRVSNNTLQFIDDRLVYLTSELKEVETNIQDYKTSRKIPLDIKENADRYTGEMMDNQKEQAQLEIQVNILQSIEDYLKKNSADFKLIPSNLQVASPAVSNVLENFNQLLLERDRLMKSATPDNPVVADITDQLTSLKATLLQSIQENRRQAQLSLKNVTVKNNYASGRLNAAPRMQRELVEIARQQYIKESLFLFLLQKREETALTMAITTPNARVIDTAISSSTAVTPKRRSIQSMALFLGLAIPALIVFLLDMLNDTVRTQKDLDTITNAPLLAGISYNAKSENIVVRKGSRTSIAEMFRLLRTNLQFLGAGQENKVILITSSTSGEGKSFITINLGASLALSNKKTVLVSLDLRKPKLSRYLEKEDTDLTGISNYLTGNANLEDIILPTGLDNYLFYLPSGPVPPNPAELIMSPQMAILFQYLRTHFDYIIIDTPPIGLVADALLLNTYIDSSLYVVRYGVTKKGQLGILEDIYQNGKLKKPGIVFNGIKVERGYGGYEYGYSYGYGYGYGNSYGYGYYSDEPTKKK